MRPRSSAKHPLGQSRPILTLALAGATLSTILAALATLPRVTWQPGAGAVTTPPLWLWLTAVAVLVSTIGALIVVGGRSVRHVD